MGGSVKGRPSSSSAAGKGTSSNKDSSRRSQTTQKNPEATSSNRRTASESSTASSAVAPSASVSAAAAAPVGGIGASALSASSNATAISAKNDGTSAYRSDIEPFQWDSKSEFTFYKLVINNRPVGVNRHYNMMVIYDKFIKELSLDPKLVHVDDLWKKLRTLYNLEKLEANLESRYPVERQGLAVEKEYELPEEFSHLKVKQESDPS